MFEGGIRALEVSEFNLRPQQIGPRFLIVRIFCESPGADLRDGRPVLGIVGFRTVRSCMAGSNGPEGQQSQDWKKRGASHLSWALPAVDAGFTGEIVRIGCDLTDFSMRSFFRATPSD
jgi:hypothetical protein